MLTKVLKIYNELFFLSSVHFLVSCLGNKSRIPSFTFSLLVFTQSEEQAMLDGESKEKLLIFKLIEVKNRGAKRDREGGGGKKTGASEREKRDAVGSFLHPGSRHIH